MRNQNILNSPRFLELKNKKRQILKKKILFLFSLFILILVGLSFLSKWEKTNINDIQVSGNRMTESKLVEEIVKEKIVGNYFWIFPKSNILLYPKNEIERNLLDKFKRIKNVLIDIKNVRTLNILLTEREALYTYCGNEIDSDVEKNKCYFMDNAGYIFDEAPYFSGEVYLKFYGKTSVADSTPDNPSGSYFLQSNFVNMILLKETLEKIGIKPAIFYLDENDDIRMFLSSLTKSEKGPEIIFKSDENFEKIIENLQAVLSTEPLKSDFKNKYSSISYIDLRYGNKVYYKFK